MKGVQMSSITRQSALPVVGIFRAASDIFQQAANQVAWSQQRGFGINVGEALHVAVSGARPLSPAECRKARAILSATLKALDAHQSNIGGKGKP